MQQRNSNFKLGSLEMDLCVIDASHGLLPYEIVFFDNPENTECSGCFSSNLFLSTKKCIRRSSYYGQNEKDLLPHMLNPMKHYLAACLGFQNFVFFPLLNKKTHIWKPYNWSGMRMKLLAPIKITNFWLIVNREE